MPTEAAAPKKKTKPSLAEQAMEHADEVLDAKAKKIPTLGDTMPKALIDPKVEAALVNAEIHAPAPLPSVSRAIRMIPIGQLCESPTNPRKTFANMDALIASVKATGGIMVPLIVRANGGPDDDSLEIVAGHRRYRAAKAAKLAEVPCDVRELDDTQVLEIQITENLQREDLTDLEEAETFEMMQTVHGYSADQIATKIGVSVGTVYSRLKLLALAPEARKALAEGKLPPSVAVPLARLPGHGLQAKALKELAQRFVGYDDPAKVINARQAISFLQDQFCQALRGAPFKLTDSMLVPDAGACSVCPKNSATATPGLFDDLKGGAFCTDTACFRQKSAAAWALLAQKAEADGCKVLSLEEGARLYAYGNLGHGSKYTELDQPNHADKSKRTWRDFFDKLPADQRPQLIVCPDKLQKAHEIVDTADLLKALAESPSAPKWAVAEQKEKEKKKAEAKAAREDRGEIELRERTAAAAVQKIGASMKKLDETAIRFVLVGLSERWVPQPVLDALGCGDHEGFDKMLAKADLQQLQGMLLVYGAFHGDLMECADGYPDALKKLAKAHDVDVKAIEKAIAVGDEAEALMKKPAKAKA